MTEEAHYKSSRRQAIAQELVILKPALSGAGDYVNQLFDEFVREDEWELALHLVCDYLLKPEIQAPQIAIIEQIENLHQLMKIVDGCAADLRRKAGAT